jgi:hypothetical protein
MSAARRLRAVRPMLIGLGTCLLSVAAWSQCTDDLNDCTVNDVCDGNGTCRGAPVPDGTPCNMPLSNCIVRPHCVNGSCIGGEQAPDGTPCRTLNSPCFTEGRCMLGFCQGSNPIDCPDDGDPCTSDFCSPFTERCESFPLCPDFGCSVGQCDPQTQECTYTPINEGQACDDFDACTIGERCVDGNCVGTLVDTPTPSVTPLVTATPRPSPSSTQTPTLTATPAPTATAVHTCPGDCNGDGEVTVDDLIVMVNIAQGSQPVSACSPGDTNDDGEITIEEVLQGVNRALSACEPALRTVSNGLARDRASEELGREARKRVTGL